MIFAYIDPGSGSMLLQVLLAGALSVPFIFRNAISSGWRRLRGQSAPSTERAEPGEPVERSGGKDSR